MTFSEPNSATRRLAAEAREFLDEPQRSQDREEGDDPTRRITGALPLAPPADGDDAPDPDGFVRLQQEHHEIEQEFTTLEEDDAVREVCEHLTEHIRREDTVLVSALRGVEGGDTLAERVMGENSVLTTMIAELRDSATPERIPELISALRGAVSAHLEAVESVIVPAFRAGGIARQLADDLDAVTTRDDARSQRGSEHHMTDPKPGDQTGADPQENEPEIGPGTQPGDDGDETGTAGGRP